MSGLTVYPRVIYGDASGAAKALTTSYTASDFSPAYDDSQSSNQGCLMFTTSGTVPTSFEWKVQISHDASSWFDELTEEVSAGAVSHLVAVRSLPTANGSYVVYVPIPSGRYFRIVAKRTGGDGTTSLIARATFGSV